MADKFEPKDMSGGLFKNGKKLRGGEQPDYTGYVIVGGARLQIAGWKKTSKAGDAYISLKLEVSGEGEGVGAAATSADF